MRELTALELELIAGGDTTVTVTGSAPPSGGAGIPGGGLGGGGSAPSGPSGGSGSAPVPTISVINVILNLAHSDAGSATAISSRQAAFKGLAPALVPSKTLVQVDNNTNNLYGPTGSVWENTVTGTLWIDLNSSDATPVADVEAIPSLNGNGYALYSAPGQLIGTVNAN